MDCEHFDRVVLDWLYKELDEIEASATQRHLAHCTRCRTKASRLRASREVGLAPHESVSETLHARILEAERIAHAELPLPKRVGRLVSVLAGWTMRPQLAMGALLLLMIGASLVFLRARPSDSDSAGITERGVPEPRMRARSQVPVEAARYQPATATATSEEAEGSAPRHSERTREPEETRDAGEQAKPPPTPIDAGSAKSRFEAAVSNFRKGAYAEARGEFELLGSTAAAVAPHAKLFAARAIEHEQGCASAIPRYEALRKTLDVETLILEATWLAAECERRLKRWDAARTKYEKLRTAPSYGARADQALRALKRASIQLDAGPAEKATRGPLDAGAD